MKTHMESIIINKAVFTFNLMVAVEYLKGNFQEATKVVITIV